MAIKIYLAAGMGTAKDWRQDLIKECGDYDIEWLAPIDEILGTSQSLAVHHAHAGMFHLGDRYKIDRADIVVAYFTDNSPSRFSGTSWECGYAHARGKVVLVINDMKPSNATFYELVKRLADFHCTTFKEGITQLKEFLHEIGYTPKNAGKGEDDEKKG